MASSSPAEKSSASAKKLRANTSRARCRTAGGKSSRSRNSAALTRRIRRRPRGRTRSSIWDEVRRSARSRSAHTEVAAAQRIQQQVQRRRARHPGERVGSPVGHDHRVVGDGASGRRGPGPPGAAVHAGCSTAGRTRGNRGSWRRSRRRGSRATTGPGRRVADAARPARRARRAPRAPRRPSRRPRRRRRRAPAAPVPAGASAAGCGMPHGAAVAPGPPRRSVLPRAPCRHAATRRSDQAQSTSVSVTRPKPNPRSSMGANASRTPVITSGSYWHDAEAGQDAVDDQLEEHHDRVARPEQPGAQQAGAQHEQIRDDRDQRRRRDRRRRVGADHRRTPLARRRAAPSAG